MLIESKQNSRPKYLNKTNSVRQFNKSAPHSFLFFQVLPHLSVNGTNTIYSIIQARNFRIILNPLFPFTSWEANKVARGMEHYYFALHAILCTT